MRPRYIDRNGNHIYVAYFQDPDHGWFARWGVSRNGMRLKLPCLPLVDAEEIAQLNLDLYAHREGLAVIEEGT